jgi:serine/threonine protein kinase
MRAAQKLKGSVSAEDRRLTATVPDTPAIVIDGSVESPIVIAASPFTVGRKSDCDLVILNPFISRHHAEIVFEDGAFFIEDKGSRHGTFVNGARASRQGLSAGDVIGFGDDRGARLIFGAHPDSGDGAVNALFSRHHTSAVAFPALFPDDKEKTVVPRAGGTDGSAIGPQRKGSEARSYEIPGKLGPYEMLREIGRGGSTVVCLAQNEYSAVGRQVALKLPLYDQDKRHVAHEAKLWKRLSDKAHPNILNLEDLNKVDDIVFFVMEYMDGGSLDAALRGITGSTRAELVLDALPGIVEGLAFAHSESIVHGDIKPQNIFLSLDRKSVKIGDFGLSQSVDADADARAAGEVAGTWSFMAPESFDGVRNYQTDIYALGATLYYLISGKGPRRHTGSLEDLKKERMNLRPDLSGIAGLPPWLASTIERCMDPLAENRFKDALELRDYVVPLVEPRKARQLILTAWCNPESESVEYDLEISGDRSREMLNVEVTYGTVAGLASEFDEIGHLVLERLAARSGGENLTAIEETIRRKLKNVGDDGSHFVLGPRVRKMLMAERPSALWFLYDPRLAGVPWELLDVDGLPLCRRFSFSRWPKLRSLSCPSSYRLDGEIRVLIVANPSGDLPGASKECSRLIEEFKDSPLSGRLKIEIADENDSAFSLRSKMRRCQILHYAGHAVFADRGGDLTRCGWLFKGNPQYPNSGDLLRAGALSGFWSESPPLLVFANACRSGQGSARAYQQRVTADAAMGLAQAFLGAGVGNYIGTVWESPDDDGTVEFASAFYRDFFSGRSVGDSVVSARNHCAQLFGEEDLTWARYALFGDPLSHILVRWWGSNRR